MLSFVVVCFVVICIYVCLYVCIYICMYVYMYVCMHACMYIYIYIYMCVRIMYNVCVIAAITCFRFPLQLTENPTMADRLNKACGAAGRTVAGAAAAVNPAMIDENGSFNCLHSCVQCYIETEVVIGSPSTLAQSYVNCVATFVLF